MSEGLSAERRAALALLTARRSVAPRRLHAPGPDAEATRQALRAALRAPDHAALVPWRVIEFGPEVRAQLADAFLAEKLRRDPDAADADRERTRAHALEPPGLFGFVARIDGQAAVPAHEQWLAAGAALGNLLHAFDLLGFGAIVLSGARCADPGLAATLGVGTNERLVGFISVGTVGAPPRPAAEPAVERVLSRWRPDEVR